MSNSSQYSVPLIFKKIMNSNFTGELILKGGNYTKNLYFKDGNLIYAKSNIFDEKLGVLLFLLGKISEEQYENIEDLTHNADLKVGEILIQNDFISKEDLLYARIHQIKKIAVNSFLLKNLNYKIINMEPVTNIELLSIPLPSIIIEGVGKMRDLSFFKDKIQFHSPSTLSIPKSIKNILTNDQLRLYKNLNECRGMSNYEIISSFTLNPEDYWKEMLIFILFEIVDFQEHDDKYDINDTIHDLINLNEELSQENPDYYHILGINKEPTIEIINRAYEQMSHKYDSKKFGSALAPEIKKIAESVSLKLNHIHQRLVSLNKKHTKKKYDSIEVNQNSDIQAEISENIYKEKNDTAFDKKSGPCQIAEDHYKMGNYQNAIDILKNELMGAPLKGEYYYLLGLSQSHQDFNNIEAEMNLKKAIKLNPWSSDPIYSLGMLYKKQNKENLAKRCFERVMSMTVNHKDAVKAIQDLLKKKQKKTSIFSILKKDIKMGSK